MKRLTGGCCQQGRDEWGLRCSECELLLIILVVTNAVKVMYGVQSAHRLCTR